MPNEEHSLEGQSAEQVAALAQMSDDLLRNPETRGPFQRLLKKHNPKLALPEIDTEDRVTEAVKPLVKKIEEIEGRTVVNAAQETANTMFENLRESGVVKTRKDFGELVKYANDNGFQASSEKGLTNASLHRAEETRVAEPTPQSAASSFFKKPDEDAKNFMKDPTGYARQKATQVMDEIIKNRGRAAA